jgi:hypothetical protein
MEDELLGGLWAQRAGIADWWGAHARATAKAAIFDRMTDNDWTAKGTGVLSAKA